MADDMTIMSDTQYGLQLMVNMGLDYSRMELYNLQPVKSVVLAAQPSKPKSSQLKAVLTRKLADEDMSVVEKAPYRNA